MKKVLAFLLPLALAACASMMPGGNSMKVNLTGTEEVPPLSVPGSGSGTITISADGSVAGSVTTTGVEGTMAHIHMGARGTNGPVIRVTARRDAHDETTRSRPSDASKRLRSRRA